jgi:hypothetical protein
MARHRLLVPRIEVRVLGGEQVRKWEVLEMAGKKKKATASSSGPKLKFGSPAWQAKYGKKSKKK